MPWQARSPRAARLPGDWKAISHWVLARDPYCQLAYPGVCTEVSTQVDHIVPGDDHRPEALQGVCQPCHRIKSAREGGRAAQAARQPRSRPKAPHPGLRGSP